MTENYSGNTKIREKSSMHMRHKILFCKIFRLRISEDKNSPLSKITTSANSGKTLPTCKPVVRPADVTCTTVWMSLLYTCHLYDVDTHLYECTDCTPTLWHGFVTVRTVHTHVVQYCHTTHVHTCGLSLLFTRVASLSLAEKIRKEKPETLGQICQSEEFPLLKLPPQSPWHKCSLTYANSIMSQ
jgi:hypothetical protein